MRGSRTIALLGALAAAAAGCSDTIDPADITLDDLVGTWSATTFELTPDAGGQPVDIVANGGEATITATASGSLNGSIEFLSRSEVIDGSIAVADGKLTLTEDGDVTVFDITLSGDVLTLTTGDAEFDFNLDGEDEPASLTAVFERQ